MTKKKNDRGEVWNEEKPHNRVVSGLMKIIDFSEEEIKIPVQFPQQYGNETKYLPVDFLPQDIYDKLKPQALFNVLGTIKTHYLVDLRFDKISPVKE